MDTHFGYGHFNIVLADFLAKDSMSKNSVFPAAGAVRSMWYLSVHVEDAPRVQHYLHTECDY